MIFRFTLILIVSLMGIAHCVEFKIYKDCSQGLMVYDKIEINEGINLGDLTIAILEKHDIAFMGNSHGINSIADSPVGMDALEILSDSEMRAFGWCFSINDEVIYDYPDTVFLNKDDVVEWFFSYAYYYQGKWLEMCIPAWELEQSSICK